MWVTADLITIVYYNYLLLKTLVMKSFMFTVITSITCQGF